MRPERNFGGTFGNGLNGAGWRGEGKAADTCDCAGRIEPASTGMGWDQVGWHSSPFTQFAGYTERESNPYQVKQAFSIRLLVAPAVALVLPPFLLIPLVYRLPGAQLFKDWYEACLWISPAVGAVALVLLLRLNRKGVVSLREPMVCAAVSLACLDLVAPLLFYVLLAVVAGH